MRNVNARWQLGLQRVPYAQQQKIYLDFTLLLVELGPISANMQDVPEKE